MINLYTKCVNVFNICEENEWNIQKLEINVHGAQLVKNCLIVPKPTLHLIIL